MRLYSRKPRGFRHEHAPTFPEEPTYESPEELRAAFLQLSSLLGSQIIVESTRHGDIWLSAGVLSGLHLAEKTQMVELIVDGRELKLNRNPGKIRIARGRLDEAGELIFTDVFWGIGAPNPDYEI